MQRRPSTVRQGLALPGPATMSAALAAPALLAGSLLTPASASAQVPPPIQAETGVCTPPSATEKTMIAVGDLAIFAVAAFLFVRLMERRFINLDKNPIFGRHLGISLALFVTALGMFGLYYGITGCMSGSMWWWVGLAFFVFVIHAAYTVIVVRTE